ncbi:MAG TPA: phenylalanine--tRNA ligase subunit beta [Kiritimatiellia bacterium]|nr:phenylalanine--tRNA ligase subunit beta [Kiritimatiellia bacterium]HRU71811.1 phenylalanine--tRNA ligase subunit beta [Kiritimatiellia bacterium]
MKVPVSWLNEFVDVSDLSVRELADKLTFSGVEVEGIEEVGVTLGDAFVVGEVLACEAHANSDHLHVCSVSDGERTWQVVCGAPNARTGLKVAFARIGAVIPEGGFTIKKAKLRGVESFGMLCSARELKLSEDHSGIMELDPTLKPGTPLRDVLPPPETVLDLEITWNRPDCLSIIGIAREFAALLRRPLRLPSVAFTETEEPVESFAQVRVEDPVKCPRYTARVMTGVQDGVAPAWMRRRLELCGVRSISLTVDVTNYVMLECGQPLHAFDYRTLADRTIVVRCATPGETITTLDGVKRTLDPSMLVIADAKVPSAVAGIMGGEGSEIAAGTEHVLLESALFDPASTKFTATQLGLGTESSRRFERGVDPDLADWASRRAVALLVEHGKARVAKGVIDVDNRAWKPGEVSLRFARAQAVIGMELPPGEMVGLLTSLGLEVLASDAQGATFRIPSWRLDLTLEADLIEEIARLHGLDAIPDRMPDSTAVSTLDDTPFYARARCRQFLLGMGFSEAMHYSFLSAQELDAFDTRGAASRVVLPNPVSADYGVLRDSLLPQLAGSLGRNASRQVERAALFEMGRVFLKGTDGEPAEEERVALGMMGPFGRSAVDCRRTVTKEEAMLWLKGAVENLVAALHAGSLAFEKSAHPAMEEGWAVDILLNGERVGHMGLVSAALRHQWRMTSPMPLAELRLAPLLSGAGAVSGIQPVPQYPGVRRDIAFVADIAVTHQDIVQTVCRAGPKELTEVRLFDIFESKEIGKGKRSMAFTLEFRSKDRTLTDQEVNAAFAKIVQALKDGLGVGVREG